nr:MAG TPA: hypothetical protein [Caudoviricetes sp.]
MSKENKAVLDKAEKVFFKWKKKVLLIGARIVAEKILRHIEANGKYYNVTGNTRGSIAWGIYYDGRLQELATPLKRKYVKRRTLVQGEVDKDTSFMAPTGEVHYYGYELSEEFLMEYRPTTKSLAIVFVVGTGYAEYIEDYRHLNVMTDTVTFVRSASTGIIRGAFDMDNTGALPFEFPSLIDTTF